MRPNTAVSRRHDLFGIAIDALTMVEAVERCHVAIKDGDYLPIGVVNAAKIVTMQRNLQLKEAVAGCGMVLADGQSVVWASRVLGAPLPERVAGIDLFLQLLMEAAEHGYRVYFLGARPQVLAELLNKVALRFPGLQLVGARDGYFEPEDEPLVAKEIECSGADLLFVGISSPRKEQFLSQWGVMTGARVVHGVGGSFDVLAGVTKRAPIRWQRSGFEWLYRLLQEPRRLGPRYLKTNLSFIMLVARQAMRQLRNPRATSAPTDDSAWMPPLPAALVKPIAPVVNAVRDEDQ